MRNTHSPCRRNRLLAVVVLFCFVLTACHTHQRVALPGASGTPPASTGSASVARGDHVRATLLNGNVVNFKVEDVQSDALIAQDGQRILLQDIARLDHRRLAKGRTAALIAGLTVAGFALLVAAAFAAGPVIY